jgi:hypothetical protein
MKASSRVGVFGAAQFHAGAVAPQRDGPREVLADRQAPLQLRVHRQVHRVERVAAEHAADAVSAQAGGSLQKILGVGGQDTRFGRYAVVISCVFAPGVGSGKIHWIQTITGPSGAPGVASR